MFFRLILVIPATILQSGFAAEFILLSFPIWVSALIVGRLPTLVFKAVATLGQFHMRVGAYMLLLTSEYPRGWKGEIPATSPPTTTLPSPAPTAPEATSAVASPTGGGIASYPTPTTSLSPNGEEPESEFDFVLTEWAQGWLWILLIARLATEISSRSRGHRAGLH